MSMLQLMPFFLLLASTDNVPRKPTLKTAKTVPGLLHAADAFPGSCMLKTNGCLHVTAFVEVRRDDASKQTDRAVLVCQGVFQKVNGTWQPMEIEPPIEGAPTLNCSKWVSPAGTLGDVDVDFNIRAISTDDKNSGALELRVKSPTHDIAYTAHVEGRKFPFDFSGLEEGAA